MDINSYLAPTITALVPAAGVGTRMQSDRPKQYLNINQHTIIEYAIAVLLRHPLINHVVVAIHPQDTVFHTLPIAQDPRVKVVIGGHQRADSVLAGLNVITNSDWVLVHDAARPCLSDSDLDKLINAVLISTDGGLLAVPVSDTMKRSSNSEPRVAHTVERKNLWHAMTPQMFPLQRLKSSLERALAEGAEITDEASALEYCGYHPLLISGRSDNIKVTRPEDLALARFYLQHQQQEELL